MPVRVLLIEDNADHVLLTKKILEKAHGGYLLDASPDANDGLRRILEEDYDLVLCDYRLPDSTALDILREMRKKGRDMPFVVVTSMGNVQTGVDLMREGASDYLLKDLSYEKVLPLVIERSIGRYKAIEENKKMSEALKKSEEQYRLLAENLTDLIWTMDMDMRFTYLSPSVVRILGYASQQEAISQPLEAILTSDSLNLSVLTFREEMAIEQKEQKDLSRSRTLELQYNRKDGTTFLAEVKMNFIRDSVGGPIGILGVSRDITERKKMEEDLREKRVLLERIINSVPDFIFAKDTTLRTFICNEAFATALGKKPDELIGHTDIENGWDPELVRGNPAKGIRGFENDDRDALSGKTVHNPYDPANTPNGILVFDTYKMPLYGKDGEIIGMLGIARDITERRKADEELRLAYKKLRQTQQELIQTSKMAAMGQLAAGISHELNQPLTGIKGFTQAVLADLEKESPFRNDLNKIVEQVDRIDTIIKNVRFFARKSDFNMVELDINHVVSDSLMLLNQQLKTCNIRVIQELGLGIPKMQGDHNQLQQAFLNIISNARDAILNLNRPEGGEIRIRTLLSQDKNHLEITFQDTGCGIPEENLQHIFSPFYTTKSPDRGMGLGLSITYRIIENHQGKIEFQTKAGEGTMFRIVLPVKETKHKTKQS